MRLTIAERMALLNILPQQGGIATLRIIQDLQRKLSFSEEEYQRFQVAQKVADGQAWVEWAPQFDKLRVEINITKVEAGIIGQELMKLDQNGRLQMQALTLWEYFVEGKEPQET